MSVSVARVAQLDRALVSEAEGCGFDPRPAHQLQLRFPEEFPSTVLVPMNSAAKPAGMSGVRHRQHQDKVADLEEGGMGWRSAGSVAIGD